MDKEFAHTIIQKTKDDYNLISSHFDLTRSEPWNEFEDFKKYIKKGAKILDLGCGNGRLLNYLETTLQRSDLCNTRVDYTGLDISEKLVEIARKKYPDFEFKVGDFSKLPFEDDTFDIIFSIASFHHIPSEELRLEALNEIKRVLKKGGIFALTVWNLWEQEKYQPFIKTNNEYQITNNEYDIGDSLIPWKNQNGEIIAERYYHAFKEEEIKKLLEKAGFNTIKIEKSDFNFILTAKN